MMCTPDALDALKARAKRLDVTIGSLTDTALRELEARSDIDIIEALAHHGHLSPKQHKNLLDRHNQSDDPPQGTKP